MTSLLSLKEIIILLSDNTKNICCHNRSKTDIFSLEERNTFKNQCWKHHRINYVDNYDDDGNVVHSLHNPISMLNTRVAINKDGKKIAICSIFSDSVEVYSTITGEFLLDFPDSVHDSVPLIVSFSNNDLIIATGHKHNKCVMRCIITGNILFELRCEDPGFGDDDNDDNDDNNDDDNDDDDELVLIEFSKNDEFLLLFSRFGFGEVWDTNTGKKRCSLNMDNVFPTHDDYIRAISITNDGTRIIAVINNELRIWDSNTGELIRSCYFHPSGFSQVFNSDDIIYCQSIAVSPDGKYIAFNIKNNLICVDMGSSELELKDCGTNNVELSASAFDDNTDEACITSIVFSPDGSTIATGSDNGYLKLYDIFNGYLGKMYGTFGGILGVKFSSDSGTLSSFCKSGLISRFSIKSLLILMFYLNKQKKIPITGIYNILEILGFNNKIFRGVFN